MRRVGKDPCRDERCSQGPQPIAKNVTKEKEKITHVHVYILGPKLYQSLKIKLVEITVINFVFINIRALCTREEEEKEKK